MSIKPISTDIFLTYQCPNCECEWSFTPKQVQMVGKMFCNNCETLTLFEPLRSVDVTPNYGGSAPRLTEIPLKTESKALTSVQEDAIMALTGLGFGKKEATDFVTKHKFQSVEDYIQGVFRKG